MTLLVIAYPDLPPADRAWIETIRTAHDPRHGVVAAHFTLVFPTDALAPDALVAAVQRQATGFGPFAFMLRAALPFRDVTGSGGDVFLVPDEGMSAFVRLHDQLYAGVLAPALRLDIPFVPHLTVGRCAALAACKRLADTLNARPFALPGTVNALDIIERQADTIRTLARVSLG